MDTVPGESVVARVEDDLAAIEHALRRLDAGTYPLCEICGRSIGDDLFDVDPVRRRCCDHAGAGPGGAR